VNRGRKKIVVLGVITRMPVAGAIWWTLNYLVGLRRLGYDVYYVEAHGDTPDLFIEQGDDQGSERAAAFLDGVMGRFGLGDRWAYHAVHDDGRCYGLSEEKLGRLYREAELIINLNGGTIPLPEHTETGRLVYVETDPVDIEIELHDGVQGTIDWLDMHCAHFTYAENYGASDCGLPVSDRFEFRPIRQPIVLDFWRTSDPPVRSEFTTVANWRQPWRDVTLDGEVYFWSKDREFLKFLELPQRTEQRIELALGGYEPDDQRLLEANGWQVRDAGALSSDADGYRSYIVGSRGEFTVAKDQNVRLRTGWFSERSALYLAAGRPVVTQDTGFGNVLPTGEGLFALSTMDDILGALESINSDYERHSWAAFEIAREYFDAEVVLTKFLSDLGLVAPKRARAGRAKSLSWPEAP
jgi:hypothetical protein